MIAPCTSTKRILRKHPIVVFCSLKSGHRGKHRFVVEWTDAETTQ